MTLRFLKLNEQNIGLIDDLEIAFKRVVSSGSYVSGSEVKNFESEFARIHNVKYAVACNSGTSALYLSLVALGISYGDEVIVPGMTFIATIEAVVMTGATPVVVDVDEYSLNLNVACVEEGLSSKTKAVVFVHLHGNSSGVFELAEFCRIKGIPMLEDAAQAHLSGHTGVLVGNFGAAAAFSFYPGKNLGAIGEGGCVITNDIEVAERMRLIRNWGSKKKYVHEVRGGNYRMDELQAAFLSVKLKHIRNWTEIRRGLAKEYFNALKEFPNQLPKIEAGADHVFHIFALRHDCRSDLKDFLQQNDVETGIHYPDPISELRPWQSFVKIIGSQENARLASRQLLSLPISESHTIDEIMSISDLVLRFLQLRT
jgi:dTDP-4-amino-4,6-dideoxygalactose transaminase